LMYSDINHVMYSSSCSECFRSLQARWSWS